MCLRALLGARYAIDIVYTQPDRPSGRGKKSTRPAVKITAEEHGLDVRQPTSFRAPGVIEELVKRQVDAMIVAAYGELLPPAVLTLPAFGCINVHASLLPRWRGASPVQSAILAGDAHTGITIMKIAEKLDAGAILYQRDCPILDDDTAGTLQQKLAQLGARCLLETLPRLFSNTIEFRAQDERPVTYAEKIGKSQAMIDWRESAAVIARKVRAFNPWPMAHTHLLHQDMRVWQARAVDRDGAAEPGTIVRIAREGIEVAAGEGSLRLEKIQLPGRKPISVADFINANPDLKHT